MNQDTADSFGMSKVHKLLLTLSLALSVFLSNLLQFGFGPFLPAMARDIGVSVSLVGQVPGSMALLAAGLALISGPMADRFGYRRVLVIALASLTLCTLCISLAASFVLLVFAALLGAFSRATATPVAQAVAGERFADDERRRALSWITAGVSGAVIIGVPVLTSVDTVFGWRGAFAVLALLAMGNLLLVARAVPPGRSHLPTQSGLDIGGVIAGYRAVCGHRPTLGLISAFAIFLIGWTSIVAYLGAFFAETYGYDAQRAGLVYAACGLGHLVGSVATGGRLGARPLRPLLIACRIGAIPLLGLALLLPLPAVGVVGILTAVAFSGAIGNVGTATLLAAENRAGRATTMALFATAATGGTGLGSALGGVVLSVSGYPSLGIVAMALCVASAIVLWWSRPVSNTTGPNA